MAFCLLHKSTFLALTTPAMDMGASTPFLWAPEGQADHGWNCGWFESEYK
jgi:hypothetical protein